MVSETRSPDLKLDQFEGPLDLLCHLIERNQIDIYDIPIARITDQYLEYLAGLQELDMELASSFLLMAATLLHIKSRLLLPQRDAVRTGQEPDPREELVLRLLEYRRCKTMAADLKRQHALYADSAQKLPETAARLDLDCAADPEPLNWDDFLAACRRLARQNELRFQDLRAGMTQILQREKVSVKDKMRQIWLALADRTRLFFNELFPADQSNRTERVTGFLALLELMRLNKLRVRQERLFDVILIERNPLVAANAELDDQAIEQALGESPAGEKAYG